MSLREDFMDRISEVIDMKCEYKFCRRPYDDDFANAHGISTSDISNRVFIPCLECGNDIMPRIILGKSKSGKQVVFCCAECRSKHAATRLYQITENTNIGDLADSLLRRCMTIEIKENPGDVKKRTTPLVVRKLLAENNRLLELILGELRGRDRKP
jgi:hypothetical protein